MAHLLLIDDDVALVPEQVKQAFAAPAHRVEIAHTGAAGLAHISNDPPDVILLDVRLPDQSGLDVYRQIKALDARIPVIFITMTKGAEIAIEAMKLGAFEYLFKPLNLNELRRVVDEAIEVSRRMRQPAVMAKELPADDVDGAIVGGCAAMLEVYKSIGRVAAQDVPVLINGESGTGKELVARAIYQYGARSKGPFLALNCAAIPENLLESELFGHEKGAFTSAIKQKNGNFETATGGTLFLDEIGDMSLSAQAKVLRALQEGKITRVGGEKEIKVDVRVIAATNKDLRKEIAAGNFREDLYHRLSVILIHVPPLNARKDDIPLLTDHFLKAIAEEQGSAQKSLEADALQLLQNYDWTGNIRELRNVVERLIILGGKSISKKDVEMYVMPK